MTAPASSVNMKSAAGLRSGEKDDRAEPAARAAADVVVITISRVLATNPPVIGPAKLA